MQIRPATKSDVDQLWEIFREVISAGDTYAYDGSTTKDDFEKLWFGKNSQSYVAETDNQILGTYFIKPNQPGRGSHIANGGYMVRASAQGQGIGKKLGIHSIEEAKKVGYTAMQFNFVVSTNLSAVRLWKEIGFEIIGTIPEAFNHDQKGLVDALVMYRTL